MKLKDFFNRAQNEKWAIGQFNFSNFEILKGIVLAAKRMSSPVILGTSEEESKFFGLEEAVALVKILRKNWEPIFLNLDHGKSFDYIKRAIDFGYDCVHFDGSGLSIEENIRITREVVRYAKKKRILVEGEVGVIPKVGEKGILTDPADALIFFEKTMVNNLAISIGNIQGVEISGSNPHLNLKRLKEIKEKLGKRVFFVLHGGSGTQTGDIKKAIKIGIVKININTELRLAYKNSLNKIISENKEIIPYRYLPKIIKAVQKVVEEKIKLFGSGKKYVEN